MFLFRPFLIVLSIALLFVFPLRANPVQEILRAKVEHSVVAPITIGLEQVHCQKTLARFYEQRLYSLAWLNPQRIESLIQIITKAGNEGLNPYDYHLTEIRRLAASTSLSPSQQADQDLLLTDAALLYASHLLSGKLNARSLDPEWYVSPTEGNPLAFLQQALASSNSLADAYGQLKPQHATYKGLKKSLAHYRKLQLAGGWPVITDGPALRAGMEDSRLPLIRKRLLTTGDLPSSTQAGTEYNQAVEEAVRSFQQRHGLTPDGVLGSKTLQAMNVSVEERIAQIIANLERWRWLSQSLGNYYLLVNIADYTLEVIKEGQLVRQHKVIAGKQARKTPVLSSKLTYLVLNPTWTVPPTILTQDIIPAARENIGILKTKNLTIYDGQGRVVDPATINWSGNSVKSYTFRQPPGPDNALGAVKFMFMNPYNVYLHDTPNRKLFNETERALSSGCIRVQHPLELAEYLLQNEQKYSLQAINKIIEGRQTTTVAIPEHPMVHIQYWTSWTNKEGILQFRPDIYQRDEALLQQLQEPAPVLLRKS